MTALEALAVLVAGLGAGTINAVVGSGTLITFPVLLAVGYPPLTANVSNALGLVPGSVAGAVGYRRELAGQGRRALRLGVFSSIGGLAGAAALLALPEEAFDAIVPAIVALAVVLVVLQPRLQALLERRRGRTSAHEGPALKAGVLGAGVYGGYFGAAQGILLIAILGLSLPDDLHRVNALKNVLAGVVNLLSGIVFAFAADVAWEAVAVLAVGATVGGVLGGRYGRRLPPRVLRGVIVVVGVAAIAQLLL